MKLKLITLVLGLTALAPFNFLQAHEEAVHNHNTPQKVAQAIRDKEKKQAEDLKIKGPKETKGISGRLLGSVDLAGQGIDVEKQILRAREFQVEPGGVIAVHRHDKRPGVLYILEGEFTEYVLGKEPAVRKAGDSAFERTGVIHYWKNNSKANVKAIMVDMIEKE